MDKKNQGIIATLVAVFLCGCPGLFAVCFGALMAMVGFIPDADIDIFGSTDPQSAINMGIASLCGGLLFVAIPIVIGIVMLRKKPEDVVSNDPLPPTS